MQRKTTQQWREQIIDVQNNLDQLKDIMLSDKSQYQKIIYCILIPVVSHSQSDKSVMMENRSDRNCLGWGLG